MTYYEDYELLEEIKQLKKELAIGNTEMVLKHLNKMQDNLVDTLIDNDVCPECGNDLEAIIEHDETGAFVVGQRCTCCGKEFEE